MRQTPRTSYSLPTQKAGSRLQVSLLPLAAIADVGADSYKLKLDAELFASVAVFALDRPGFWWESLQGYNPTKELFYTF